MIAPSFPSFAGFVAPSAKGRSTEAFTLVELLVVMGIIALLSMMAIPALTGMRGATNITAAAYEISETLQQARAYAMANGTYVWVGFYEEDASSSQPTTGKPPYNGKGQLVLASVASKDGTSAEGDGPVLTLDQVIPIAKIRKISGIHLGDLGSPKGGPQDTFDSRPNAGPGNPRGLSSDSGETATFPFEVGQYIFYKTVRFSPRGEVVINGTDIINSIAEIGLLPARGSVVMVQSNDVAAIQLTGIGGNVKIYRP